MEITENTYFIRSRYDFTEDVNTNAYEYATYPKAFTKEEVTHDLIEVFQELQRDNPDSYMTEEEAWEKFESEGYDFANYGTFSVSDFIDSVYEKMLSYIKELSEEDEENEE